MSDHVLPRAALPNFKYHRDPVATGSISRSSLECAACRLVRGWTYAGPVYGRFDEEPAICPWCIADGTVHRSLAVEFVDPLSVGGYGDWEPVRQSVLHKVCFRTPSFSGWQQERWYTHCNDAAVFVGIVGFTELQALDAAAYNAIALESGFAGKELEDYMESLDKDNGPTAYVFRWLSCAAWGGYSDIH